MKRRIICALLCLNFSIATFSVAQGAASEKLYHFCTNFYSSTDMVATVTDNSGGGWSTGTQGIVAEGGHDNGSYVAYHFKTKMGGNATSNGSYGFRFPIWTSSSACDFDLWKPDGINSANLPEAIADGESVSLWIKTEQADFARTIMMKFETKPAVTGGQSKEYKTGKITLPQNGDWNLLQIPLSEFKNNGTAINATVEGSPVVNSTTNIPYKFSLMVNYTDFAQVAAPETEDDILETYIAMDDFMIERKITDAVQPVAMLNYDQEYASDASVKSMMFDDNTVDMAETMTLSYPAGTTLDMLDHMLLYELTSPLRLTDTKNSVQYKNGATAVFVKPQALPGDGMLVVTSGDGLTQNTYTLHFVQGAGEIEAIDKRYNYFTHCEETTDHISALSNTGGGWSTKGGSSGKITGGGLDGSNALRVTFSPKTEGEQNITQNCSYGFRFPTWSSDSTYVSDIWHPEAGVDASLSEALADTEAISLWIKVPPAEFSRKVALCIECKPEDGTVTAYETSPISLVSDGQFHLYQIPTSDFLNGSTPFSQCTAEEIAQLRPYKFAFATNYPNFLNIDSLPAEAEEVYIHFDDVIFERTIDKGASCPYPIVVPLEQDVAYANDATLVGLSVGGFHGNIVDGAGTLSYPKGMGIEQFNPYTVSGSFTNPTVLTDVSQGVQYKNGAVITDMEGTLEDGVTVTTYSGDYTQKKVYQVSLMPQDIADPMVLGSRIDRVAAKGYFYVVTPVEINFSALSAIYQNGNLLAMTLGGGAPITGGATIETAISAEPDADETKIMLWDIATLTPYHSAVVLH